MNEYYTVTFRVTGRPFLDKVLKALSRLYATECIWQLEIQPPEDQK